MEARKPDGKLKIKDRGKKWKGNDEAKVLTMKVKGGKKTRMGDVKSRCCSAGKTQESGKKRGAEGCRMEERMGAFQRNHGHVFVKKTGLSAGDKTPTS